MHNNDSIGTKFIELDAVAGPSDAATQHFNTMRNAAILISDGCARDSYLIKSYLQFDGFRNFCVTRSAPETVPLAGDFKPDLILLDLRPPEMGGLDVLRALRSDPASVGVPVVVMTGDVSSDVQLHSLQCGATDLLQKPLIQAEVLGRTRNVLAAKLFRDRTRQYVRQLEEDIRTRGTELDTARREVVHCLARAAEFRDDDTGQHIIRVGRYARIIGEELGLSEEALNILEPAAQLHDVGKIGIPDDILLKPHRLSTEEFYVMQKHCGFGKKILRHLQNEEVADICEHMEIGARIMDIGHSPLLSVARRIALTHHERWDGTGYPVGLAGDDIPLEGRITAVADVFDALSTKRPYKPAYPLDKCLAIIEDGRGTQFDPAIVDAFNVRRSDIVKTQIAFADMD